jgi:chromate reductase, NAD(P)H dehydrogenase (quinone)
VTDPRSKIEALGIAGSLREGSYNRALLRAARDLAPDGLEIRIYEGLADIPLYNEDVRARGEPEPVVALKEAIRRADALLWVTPEYNYSIPGVLKNAIDWASRPPKTSPLNGKPAAIMGATTGSWGTVRSQMHLRQVCVYTNMLPINKPQVLVARARSKFDEDGKLVDETTQGFVRQLLEALVEWALRLQGGA